MNRMRATALALMMVFCARAAQAQTAPQMPSQAQMKATLGAYFEAMNLQETAKLKAMYADDAMVEDPAGAAPRPAAAFVDAVAPLKLNFNVLLLTATQTSTAAAALYIGMAEGGLNAIEVFTFKPDGKIASMKALWGADDRQK